MGKEFRDIAKQKGLIESFYECFDCTYVGQHGNKRLKCIGQIQPTEVSTVYKITLSYDGKKAPRVYVLEPEIEYDIKAHMYEDKRLCLYDPRENPWKSKYSIADTIIPWTSAWLIYYELYQMTGVWEGPEAPHDTIKIKG